MGELNGLIQGVAAEAGGRPSPVLSVCLPEGRVCQLVNTPVLRRKCCLDSSLSRLLPPVLSAARVSTELSSPPPPPILHQYIWHIPVLIVQAELPALFRICIRMLFLYNSKQRHVEPLLNCSANRRRFQRCLYKIR